MNIKHMQCRLTKDVNRRFNTIHNQINDFGEDTKKFDRTITYFRDSQITRTNNKLE